ncbi:hypothetical protein QQY66_38855 [Streptomyces sp. DG2A-72]|uniref:hypothetical protein n=1 Tax=Streptomyces sp. DG2A-72 TaxID=3051386 RepID=UPI00265BA877|nr:hypothetical protein [Streptomyces sp. DG2A-72]MDO0937401.1 hypothetical protein [Streptomyces sp. DG2A-72]
MIERKTASNGVTVKAVAGTDASGRIEATFVTFGVRDHDGDIVEPGAVKEGPVIISGWNHSAWGPNAMPIGRGSIKVVGNTARVVGELFMDSVAGRDAHAVLKGLGDLAEFSWSLDEIKSRMGKDIKGRPTRYISSVKVREISPVLQAASIGTELVSIKSRSDISDVERRELLRIRKNLETDELITIRERLDEECRHEALRTEVERLYHNYVKEVGVGYSYDKAWIVPQTVRDAAYAAIGTYAPELGLDRDQIRIKWFSAEDGADEFMDFWSEVPLLGRCHPKAAPSVIELNSGLSEDDCWNVVPHELRHISHPEESEEDVRLYESRSRLQRMGY